MKMVIAVSVVEYLIEMRSSYLGPVNIGTGIFLYLIIQKYNLVGGT